ncbi:hypothetical protein [Burkholderia gladioli]|uniref:hypothetical protein n=1 Tax=Burkholderia gladioli TaxID=28095 RepID=UPI001F154707|nr:hypothetical protein [Burkholderia gladioli]
MSTPTLDLSVAENVRRELLDDDRGVRDAFAAALGGELADLAVALAACFDCVPSLHTAAAQTETRRNALVAGFAFGVLDDLVVSTKLLLAGKAAAAGNVMRQVIEGIAMAAMCATDELLVIERSRQKGQVRVRYWEKVWHDDSRVQGGGPSSNWTGMPRCWASRPPRSRRYARRRSTTTPSAIAAR